MIYGNNISFVIIQEKDFSTHANAHIGKDIDIIYVPKHLKDKWDENHLQLKASLLPCLTMKGKVIFI